MKTIIPSFILLFLIFNHLQSQQLVNIRIYKNDNSYLKMYQDTAEFKIYTKEYLDTMEYRTYKKNNQDTIVFFNRLQKYHYIEGKGTFNIKDSIIHINPVHLKRIGGSKTNMYLTDTVCLRNRKVKFRIERKGNLCCVRGPLKKKPKLRFSLKFGFYKVITTHSNEITMCRE